MPKLKMRRTQALLPESTQYVASRAMPGGNVQAIPKKLKNAIINSPTSQATIATICEYLANSNNQDLIEGLLFYTVLTAKENGFPILKLLLDKEAGKRISVAAICDVGFQLAELHLANRSLKDNDSLLRESNLMLGYILKILLTFERGDVQVHRPGSTNTPSTETTIMQTSGSTNTPSIEDAIMQIVLCMDGVMAASILAANPFLKINRLLAFARQMNVEKIPSVQENGEYETAKLSILEKSLASSPLLVNGAMQKGLAKGAVLKQVSWVCVSRKDKMPRIILLKGIFDRIVAGDDEAFRSVDTFLMCLSQLEDDPELSLVLVYGFSKFLGREKNLCQQNFFHSLFDYALSRGYMGIFKIFNQAAKLFGIEENEKRKFLMILMQELSETNNVGLKKYFSDSLALSNANKGEIDANLIKSLPEISMDTLVPVASIKQGSPGLEEKRPEEKRPEEPQIATKSDLELRVRALSFQGDLGALKNVVNSSDFKGFDCRINAVGPTSGRSALHQAAMQGHIAVVLFLLECGADPDLKDLKGKTPESLATENGHAAVAEKLRDESEKKSKQVRKEQVIPNKIKQVVDDYRGAFERAQLYTSSVRTSTLKQKENFSNQDFFAKTEIVNYLRTQNGISFEILSTWIFYALENKCMPVVSCLLEHKLMPLAFKIDVIVQIQENLKGTKNHKENLQWMQLLFRHLVTWDYNPKEALKEPIKDALRIATLPFICADLESELRNLAIGSELIVYLTHIISEKGKGYTRNYFRKKYPKYESLVDRVAEPQADREKLFSLMLEIFKREKQDAKYLFELLCNYSDSGDEELLYVLLKEIMQTSKEVLSYFVECSVKRPNKIIFELLLEKISLINLNAKSRLALFENLLVELCSFDCEEFLRILLRYEPNLYLSANNLGNERNLLRLAVEHNAKNTADFLVEKNICIVSAIAASSNASTEVKKALNKLRLERWLFLACENQLEIEGPKKLVKYIAEHFIKFALAWLPDENGITIEGLFIAQHMIPFLCVQISQCLQGIKDEKVFFAEFKKIHDYALQWEQTNTRSVENFLQKIAVLLKEKAAGDNLEKGLKKIRIASAKYSSMKLSDLENTNKSLFKTLENFYHQVITCTVNAERQKENAPKQNHAPAVPMLPIPQRITKILGVLKTEFELLQKEKNEIEACVSGNVDVSAKKIRRKTELFAKITILEAEFSALSKKYDAVFKLDGESKNSDDDLQQLYKSFEKLQSSVKDVKSSLDSLLKKLKKETHVKVEKNQAKTDVIKGQIQSKKGQAKKPDLFSSNANASRQSPAAPAAEEASSRSNRGFGKN
jgi:hypothetical protein